MPRPTDVHQVANTQQTASAFTLALAPCIASLSPDLGQGSGGRPMLIRCQSDSFRVLLPTGLGSGARGRPFGPFRYPNAALESSPPLIPPASMPHESVMQAMISGGYRGV